MAPVVKNCWVQGERPRGGNRYLVQRLDVGDDSRECLVCGDRVLTKASLLERHVRPVYGRLWLCTACVPDHDVDKLKETAPRVQTCWAQRVDAPRHGESSQVAWLRPRAAARAAAAAGPRPRRGGGGGARAAVSVPPHAAAGAAGAAGSAVPRSSSTPSLRLNLKVVSGAFAAIRSAAAAAQSPLWSRRASVVQRPRTARVAPGQAPQAPLPRRSRRRQAACGEEAAPTAATCLPGAVVDVDPPTVLDCRDCGMALRGDGGVDICSTCILEHEIARVGRKPTPLWLEEALMD